jgi:hypothetical protein
MRKLLPISLAAGLSMLALALPTARAQDQQNQDQQNQDQQNQGQSSPNQPQSDQNTQQSAAPIPAYRSPFASAADNDQGEETEPVTPDTRPLSGAQELSLGGLNRSYWQPHADVFGSVDSNPNETPTGGSWGTWTSFSGGVDVNRVSGNSEMTLNYLGGASISNDGSADNGIVQELGFVDRFTLRRWSLALMDEVSYLPEASFGFGGLGGIEPSTGGSAGLGPVFGVPGETILVGTGQHIANAFTTEASMNLTSRSSLTFDAGYSLLHFLDSDLLNSTEANFRGGYNYRLTRKDTIAMFVTYSAFRYSNFNQSINDYSIEGSYARRVTGRLAFQIAAGPQYAQSRIPITAASGSSGSGTTTGSSTYLFWTLHTNLAYQLERVALGLSYYHGVDAGSGVLGGSVTDTVSGSATRRMSRTFSSAVTAGYSRDTGVDFASTTSTTPTSETYSYWFAGATFSHPISSTLGLTLSYRLQYQNSNASFCVGSTCGTSLIRNVFSFGVGWHQRPLLF